MTAGLLEHGIGHLGAGDPGHGFRPSQGGAFALGVVGRFAPRIQTVKALLGFAGGAQVLPVHVDTVGAAVDL